MLRRSLGSFAVRAAPRCTALRACLFTASTLNPAFSTLASGRVSGRAAAASRGASLSIAMCSPIRVRASTTDSVDRTFSSTPVAPAAEVSLEELEIAYKRLVFHCQQRGWLELDLIMGSFVRAQRDALVHDAAAQEELRTVAVEENSDLMRWLVEGRPVPEKFLSNKMALALAEYANAPGKPWFPKGGNQ